MASSRIVPVIMCGGAGTRLWPVSRESMPKQFVPLVGPRSTFQQVLERIADPELFARPIVITNTDFRFIVAEQLRERGIEADIVLEPARRDSGPAVAVAAAAWRRSAIRRRSCWCSPPTMSSASPTSFVAACRAGRAQPRPRADRDVRHHARPHPATNYGYIRPGAQAQRRRGARGRRLRREARCRDRRALRGGQLSLEQRQLHVPRRRHARRDRALRARDGGGRQGRGRAA